jgi:hypothetical protein
LFVSILAGSHKELKYLVDFDPILAQIITETKYMEQLGFNVPELARNVALQVLSRIITSIIWNVEANYWMKGNLFGYFY